MKPYQRHHVHMVFGNYMRSQHRRNQWQLDQLAQRTKPVRMIALYASVATAILIGLWFTRYPPS